ncbi:hypothetical protein BC835DRAFT_1526713 [Cytidiella melzeri]|nr:hypothetical protein BC835DRAFT_1526713 [Cytidiella melzeri]
MHLLLPRVTEEEIGAAAPADLVGWLFFQIAAGHIALPILLSTFIFAKTVHAHPAVVTVCITWILSGVFSTLLFYVGQHTGPEPSQGLCIAQASLLGAVPTMTCSALLLLAYRMWRTWDGSDEHVLPESRRQKNLKLVIYLIPFIVFGLFVAIAVNLGLTHADRVNREQRYFYCSLDWSQFSDAVQVLSTLLCAAAVILEVNVTVKATRYWRAVRNNSHLTDEKLSLGVRTSIFTLYLFASTLVNLVSIWVPMGVVPDMLSASVGMAFFLIFVSQRAICRAWSFWKRPQVYDASRNSNDADMLFTPPPKRRYRAYRDRTSGSVASSSVPTLAGSHTLDSLKDFRYDEPPTAGPGVQIIRRPEEAFKSARIKPDKSRTTISTWGF